MHAKTTTAMALAGVALTLPAAAAAARHSDHVPRAAARDGQMSLAVLTHRRALRADRERDRLSTAATRVKRRLAATRGGEFHARRFHARLRHDPPGELRDRVRSLKRELASTRAEAAAVATPPALQAIAVCESGGNPAANTGNGFYGKYQFSAETWAAVGGTGNPAAASEAEQDRRAAMLYARAGASPWPVCGG